MAVKVESFLVLEKALAKRLGNAWVREAMPVIRKIEKAIKKGDFYEAYALVDQLDMSKAVDRNLKYIDLIGMSAVLYGASRLTNPKKSVFGSKPQEVSKATEMLRTVLVRNANEKVRQTARKIIQLEEDRRKQALLMQKADTGFVKAFKGSVIQEGKVFADLGASLHTSRLAAWGFTVEAEVRGYEYYKVDEVLDSRTCPVCREMDGKVFPVNSARSRLEQVMGVEDPDDLRALAPWPKQDKESVDRLKKMSPEEIISSGWHVPPYHPGCRGVLNKTKKKVQIGQIPTQPQTKPEDIAPVPSTQPEADQPSLLSRLSPKRLAQMLAGSLVKDLDRELDKKVPKE